MYEWWQLRFSDAESENAFLDSRSQILLRNSRFCAVVVFLTMFIYVVVNPHHCDPNHHTLPEENIAPRLVSYGTIWLGMVIAVVFFTGAPRLWSSRRGHEKGEIVVTCCVITGIVLPSFWSNYYSAKLFGLEVEDVWGTFPYADAADTHVLLEMVAFIAVSNVLLPIRVSISWIVTLVAVATIAVLFFEVGSPNGAMTGLMNFTLFSTICFAMYIGRWDLERHERWHHIVLLEEKRQRFVAEHAAEVLPQRPTSADESSEPGTMCSTIGRGTTRTGQVFDEVIAKLYTADDPWHEVKKVGKQEHWMLEADDLDSGVSEECLGEGSWARVLKGWMHGTPVALKVPKVSKNVQRKVDRDHWITVATEIRILRRLRHPNIVLLNGVVPLPDVAGSLPLLGVVLEFVPGPNLLQFILPPNETARDISGEHRKELVVGLLRALRYLHSQQPIIVHGDLKAENVLVEPHAGSNGFPRSKLTDFGLSLLFKHSDKAKADTEFVCGTPRWQGPEKLLMLFGDTSFKQAAGMLTADTYSFALICYFTVSGKLPLEGIDAKRLAKVLRQTGLPPPLEWPSHLHALRTVLVGCMAMPPQERTSLVSVQVELEKLIHEEFQIKFGMAL
eukprot:gnl/MRDRNA2_/MRDRNA2_84090_c0_seq3.p1 gnl/MRDRNA2_/MRDRNA2_84090_c0~~gnl/MRDRNA2_/MRDRNA2_84090_c0_seq3.p1  ORF type:complete len:616 (+),score=109.01 gnl/MRDRNA2_/MRDRNA2_84090_c0_seq3:2-1849(+)